APACHPAQIFAHEILYTVVDWIPTPVAHPGIRVSKRRLRHTHELKPTSKVHIRVAHSEVERDRRDAAGEGRTSYPPGRRRAQEQGAHRRHRELLFPAPNR